MNSKLIKIGVWTMCVMFLFFFLWGCGASRQNVDFSDEAVDLDELLAEEGGQSDSDAEQAEVLRLLGITPAERQAQPAQISTLSPESDADELQADVDKLQQELSDKDREISELRSQLTEREMLISDLEEKTNKSSASVRVPIGGQVFEPSPEFKSRYEKALRIFKARNYGRAISEFNDLLISNQNTSLSDNCQYWIGECYYGLADYNQAITAFDKVFQFPNSNKSDDAQLKLGLCYFKLGERNQARTAFTHLLSNYPNSEYIAVAQKYIQKL